jgi:hypothetical protein
VEGRTVSGQMMPCSWLHFGLCYPRTTAPEVACRRGPNQAPMPSPHWPALPPTPCSWPAACGSPSARPGVGRTVGLSGQMIKIASGVSGGWTSVMINRSALVTGPDDNSMGSDVDRVTSQGHRGPGERRSRGRASAVSRAALPRACEVAEGVGRLSGIPGHGPARGKPYVSHPVEGFRVEPFRPARARWVSSSRIALSGVAMHTVGLHRTGPSICFARLTRRTPASPSGSEDFSTFTDVISGCFVFVNGGDADDAGQT